jgi:gas vesicle protein
MSEKRNVIGGIAIGLLVGTLIGAAAALLSAPQPGQQTRALIREKGSEIAGKATTTVRDTRSKADAVLSEVRSRSQDFAGRLRRTNGTHVAAEIIAE